MSNVELELIQTVLGVLVMGVLLICKENGLILNGQKNGLAHQQSYYSLNKCVLL
jgi:hypothetical protein